MDSILVFPPGPSVAGSQLQLGTYLMWDPGADYGARGLISSIEAQNALRDGGVFAYRNVGPRKMAFPLLLRDVPGQTLLQTESLLRNWTTAGAKVAVQPETTPSGQAVFFDVIDGRWEPDYDGFENRAGRRRGTLYLDTQPWGYWPTEILLASAASVGMLAGIPVNAGASLMGDAPGLAHLIVNPTTASVYGPTTQPQWSVDMVAYSLSARPSFVPIILPATNATWLAGGTPSIFSDALAPITPTIAQLSIPTAAAVPIAPYMMQIPSALEPAYRGRFRAFMYAKLSPSQAVPYYMQLDAVRDSAVAITAGAIGAAAATGNQIASVYAVAPTGFAAVTLAYIASPWYSLYDMGEITLPAGGGSGLYQQNQWLRLWITQPSGAATGVINIGGLYLLPVDGAAGILTRGAAIPTYPNAASGAQAGVDWNNSFIEGVSITRQRGASGIYNSGLSFHRGVMPRLGASVNQLLVLTADRPVGLFGGSGGQFQAAAQVEYSGVSISYRPTFAFLQGI